VKCGVRGSILKGAEAWFATLTNQSKNDPKNKND
jgi:hypothetical protein